MKIAYIMSQFPTISETFILDELKGLKQRGIDLKIFSIKKSKQKDAPMELLEDTYYSNLILSKDIAKAKVYYFFKKPFKLIKTFFDVVFSMIKNPSLLMKSMVIFNQSLYFARLSEKFNINLIFGSWATHPTTEAYIINKLTGIPYAFAGHAHDIFVDQTMLKKKIKNAKFITTCTANNKKYLSNFGDPSKIFVVYHGKDLSKFKPIEKKDKIFTILSVGKEPKALKGCKGHEYLIRACNLLDFDYRCIIVAGKPEQERLRALAKGIGISDKVMIIGPLKHSEVLELYNKTDVFVLAALKKNHFGIPNTVAEAMLMKLPCIVTKLPSMPELILDGENGFLIEDENSEVIAKKIDILYKNSELRKKFGEKGRNKAINLFDKNKNLNRFKKLFEKLE